MLAWGWNLFGQIGDGTTSTRLRPVTVPGLTGVRALASGWLHTIAVGPGDAQWTWGLNHVGQLGDGTTTTRPSPVKVVGTAGTPTGAARALHSLGA